nr:hypothetical protein [uncultured Sphingobacterium sp.]
MRVTFKNVGQGDSIIIEWKDGDQNRIGLIDCNIIDKKNPVADYVNSSTYTEIDFIIMSHPHSDHYSGMLGLLEVIEKKGIKVKNFGHSVFILGADFFKYLRWMEIGTAELKELHQLITKIDQLRRSGIISKMAMIVENWQIPLAEGVSIKCLSPSQLEAEKYQEIVNFEPEKNKKAASKAANFLSTIFKLSIGEDYYLFTADSEVFTLDRLVREDSHQDLKEHTMKIGQLPHHGAEKNHHPAFWESLKKDKSPFAIISAGVHMKYNHPRFPVLESFHKAGYQIHCTSIVNGMAQYIDLLKKLGRTSAVLDTFSELVGQDMGGDKVF